MTAGAVRTALNTSRIWHAGGRRGGSGIARRGRWTLSNAAIFSMIGSSLRSISAPICGRRATQASTAGARPVAMPASTRTVNTTADTVATPSCSPARCNARATGASTSARTMAIAVGARMSAAKTLAVIPDHNDEEKDAGPDDLDVAPDIGNPPGGGGAADEAGVSLMNVHGRRRPRMAVPATFILWERKKSGPSMPTVEGGILTLFGIETRSPSIMRSGEFGCTLTQIFFWLSAERPFRSL